jgi:hypothetical protein
MCDPCLAAAETEAPDCRLLHPRKKKQEHSQTHEPAGKIKHKRRSSTSSSEETASEEENMDTEGSQTKLLEVLKGKGRRDRRGGVCIVLPANGKARMLASALRDRSECASPMSRSSSLSSFSEDLVHALPHMTADGCPPAKSARNPRF